MKKEQLIEFLEKQAEKLSSREFDPEIWKDSTMRILSKMLGPHHVFTEQCEDLEIVWKTSIEDLYPKKVVDLVQTRNKLKARAQDWIDQLMLFEESDFEAGSNGAGASILNQHIEILKNNLPGKTLRKMKEIADMEDREKALQEMTEAVKKIDVDTVQEMLAGILIQEELWKYLK